MFAHTVIGVLFCLFPLFVALVVHFDDGNFCFRKVKTELCLCRGRQKHVSSPVTAVAKARVHWCAILLYSCVNVLCSVYWIAYSVYFCVVLYQSVQRRNYYPFKARCVFLCVCLLLLFVLCFTACFVFQRVSSAGDIVVVRLHTRGLDLLHARTVGAPLFLSLFLLSVCLCPFSPFLNTARVVDGVSVHRCEIR